MNSQVSVKKRARATLAKVAPLAASALLSQLGAGYALAGTTYQLSCVNVGIGFTTQGVPGLVAVCPKVNGSFVTTSLVLGGISNQDGRLVQGAITEPSSFQLTCGISNLVIDSANTTIVAFCRKKNGSFVSTSLSLPNIVNSDGRLVYVI
jgi:hypothetical protein